MGGVVVVGSANVDHVVRVPRLPLPGETVLGTEYAIHAGGKGANQAVAAARLGAQVFFVGGVGRDQAGDLSLRQLSEEGVDCEYVLRSDDQATGAAVIAVDAAGENQIAVAPGANQLVDPELVARAIATCHPAVVLAVLEVPMAAVVTAAVAAASVGAQVIVNPAPPTRLPDELLGTGPILTPNVPELAVSAGEPAGTSPRAAALRLTARGARALLVTRGADGVIAFTPAGEVAILGERPGEVIDTTGAGDTFSGALAALLARGVELVRASRMANAAAGLSVLRAGARSGMPTRDELDAYLAERD